GAAFEEELAVGEVLAHGRDGDVRPLGEGLELEDAPAVEHKGGGEDGLARLPGGFLASGGVVAACHGWHDGILDSVCQARISASVTELTPAVRSAEPG